MSLLCALIEAGGLVLVILVGMSYWSSVDYLDTPAVAGGEPAALLVMQSAVFAFFAFIGFEDMMYVTEETREPERTLPLGLILAMAGAAMLIYHRCNDCGVGAAAARACRCAGTDHRGDGARGADDFAVSVRPDHAVRRRQCSSTI